MMNRLKKQFMEIFDLSPEIVLDLPLVMMVGRQRLFLENHKGVTHYHKNEIRIKFQDGLLLLKGEDLIVNEINSDSLSISGQLSGIYYETGNGGMMVD
jgi:sporulation protein YqfC